MLLVLQTFDCTALGVVRGHAAGVGGDGAAARLRVQPGGAQGGAGDIECGGQDAGAPTSTRWWWMRSSAFRSTRGYLCVLRCALLCCTSFDLYAMFLRGSRCFCLMLTQEKNFYYEHVVVVHACNIKKPH